MLIEKVYEDIVNLSAVEMYKNIDEIILEKLRDKFEGRCHGNSFVLHVIKVIQRSACRLIHDRLDGSGNINVIFLAQAEIYKVGDILPICEIRSIEKAHRIICSYGNHVAISIQGNEKLRSLKVGQKISVIVYNVSYIESTITVYGTAYTYPKQFQIYKLSEDLEKAPAEEINALRTKFELIAHETLDMTTQTDKISCDFFRDIYYPYTTTISIPRDQLLDLADYEEFAREGAVLCRHRAIEKSRPVVMKVPSIKELTPNNLFDSTKFSYSIVTETPVRALNAIMDDHIEFIKMIRQTAAKFSNDKKKGSHDNVWNIYRFIKTTPA